MSRLFVFHATSWDLATTIMFTLAVPDEAEPQYLDIKKIMLYKGDCQ